MIHRRVLREDGRISVPWPTRRGAAPPYVCRNRHRHRHGIQFFNLFDGIAAESIPAAQPIPPNGLTENEEKPLMDNLRKTATRTGIALTGLCGVVLLGAGKVQSGTLLIATTFVMVLPVRRPRLPRWARVGLLCAVFVMVAWNISTTDLPTPPNELVTSCPNEHTETYTKTGFTFLDQVIYLFRSFLSQAEPS
ncbi:hypothetical protein ACTWP5_05470 [Streptomyces sp. 4N509B]|uniref:hypothetical protein n=1 Tax=Streptomyces sp. 4N509B TaxID=3457413 RepID=UPI003FD2EFC8